jgi:hypothetical protein
MPLTSKVEDVSVRTIVVLAAFAVSLGGIVPAMAATSVTKGVIASFDGTLCTVTLADKSVFSFGKKCDFSKLTKGENVEITWTSPQPVGVRVARHLMATR